MADSRGATLSPTPTPSPTKLGARLAHVGARLGAREVEHRADLSTARERADEIHGWIDRALDHFHRATSEAGAPHLRVELSAPRTDDKHLRSVEFDLTRGRHRAIVTVKSKGEVTLVGPFRAGKTEGPCRSVPSDARPEIEEALGPFLERFLEEAATP